MRPQDKPDYWYVTDDEGTKFFRDEERLTLAEWREGAPQDKLETLQWHLVEYPNLREAPLKD